MHRGFLDHNSLAQVFFFLESALLSEFRYPKLLFFFGKCFYLLYLASFCLFRCLDTPK